MDQRVRSLLFWVYGAKIIGYSILLAFWIYLWFGAAHGQTAWTATTGTHTSVTCIGPTGETWDELGLVCHADALFRHSPTTVLPTNPQVATSGHIATCPDGYSLILRSPGDPACARDIIDAQ